MSTIPVMVDATRARVLVVGGGEAAAGEAAAAAEAGATVRIAARAPGAAVRDVVARMPAVSVARRVCDDDDVLWATLVFAAADDGALNARVAALAHAAGRPVSVAHDPGASSFAIPAHLRAGDLVVAVSCGAVPALADSVRDMIGERVGPAYAKAVTALLQLRTDLLRRGLEQRWCDAVDALISDDVCASIERGTFDRRLAAWR